MNKMGPSAAKLTESIKSEAGRLGFDLCGVCAAVTPPGLERFYDWIRAGYAGEMSYIEGRREAYRHPTGVLDGARSVVMLGLNYQCMSHTKPQTGQGLISKYAWSEVDYHDLIHQKLTRLKQYLLELVPFASARGVVDSAPLLEREFAELAGLGWAGKNTLLLNKQHGSWFFLAALLTDIVLSYDSPHRTDHCGTCRACLDACPTNAFVAPNLLDATKCISYLTIELRTPIPHELRSGIGNWLFGCDVCQEVCPWNNHAPRTHDDQLLPRSDSDPIDLLVLFDLDDETFRRRFRATPLWRPKRRGILRNAAIVLGNQKSPSAIESLTKGLNDAEPLVRGACAWALGEIGTAKAQNHLNHRLAIESDDDVVDEIKEALQTLSHKN